MLENERIPVEEQPLVGQHAQLIVARKDRLELRPFDRSEQLTAHRGVLGANLQINDVCLVYHADAALRFSQFLVQQVDFREEIIHFHLAEFAQIILVFDF